MQPKKPRPGPARGFVSRLLLFAAAAALLLRLAYVVATVFVSSSSFSSPVSGDRPARFYSAAFRDLISDGFLSPASKSLSLAAPSGHAALKKLGVHSLGVSRIPARQPFDNSTFDFVFAGEGSVERSRRPLELATELARVLRPEGFLAIHTASAGDSYSLSSLLDLFPCCRMIRSRELDGLDTSPAKIREVLLQKEEGSYILRPGVKEKDNSKSSSSGNSETKCSLMEQKHQLVAQAEPLIGEEPLKPWITLKRNLLNIKYLPTMADISFKNRYVYIDVGSRSYGSSIGSWFKKQYPNQNHTFEIYAIEADPHFHADYAAKKGVTLLPYAAWVRNETISFEVNHDPDQKEKEMGRGMGRIRSAGAGSENLDNVHMIQGFDFAEWLKSVVSERDFVVLKMDVEGTEFDLIPRLFETGAICLISELFLECHYNRWQRCCPGERTPKYQHTYGQCLELFHSLRKGGILVHQWW